MPKLKLSVGCGDYDRTEALRTGVVQPEGIDLTYVPIQSPPEIFARMIKNHAFDFAEMSTSMYLTLRAKNEFPFVALPVFPSKVFRHGFIFINKNSGIKTAKDLEGKRIGVPEFRQTASIWIRGILQHEYGVDMETIHWYEGGANVPREPDVLDLRPDREIDIQFIGPEKSLNDMLAAGEIDAMIGARQPFSLDTCPDVGRLFPNYRDEEKSYFKKTGIFPIMHTLVVNEELYNEQPWVAESMYKAFEQSKNWCLDQMKFSGTMRYTLPWLFADIDEMTEVFGSDPWAYGLEQNRATLEALVSYLHDQKFLAEKVAIEDMFIPIVSNMKRHDP
ncbi:MAG: ABC transporter substrate-binding protein [Gammaproteobacteria bacterium]|jgi:4,5-dihydroxyphthalate decarboxylase